MSELIQKNDNRATIRWKLLTGVSAFALAASISSGRAEDGSQPQIWIDLGGQLSRLSDEEESFSPPLMANRPAALSPSAQFEKQPLYSVDETGSVTLRPSASDWVFSGTVHFGRSGSKRDSRQQTNPSPFIEYGLGGTPITFYPVASQFADTIVRNSERHLIIDFQVGRDVGFGLFGEHGSSVLNLGVRFAQFRNSSNITLQSDPDWHFTAKYLPNGVVLLNQSFHTNRANLLSERNFHGVGPSLSWSASAPFAGVEQDGELSVDWGLNASLLFGRRRAKIHHQATAEFRPPELGANPGPFYVTYQPTPVNKTRMRSITVPNVGGTLGLTYRMQNFKVSMGYRADFFFNAIDGGVDTRKTENRGFFGPYASISVGFGD